MIRKVARYETSDGKLFDDESVAKEHEATETAVKELSAILETSLQTKRVDSVVREVVLLAHLVRPVLAKYGRALPRQSQSESEEAKAA